MLQLLPHIPRYWRARRTGRGAPLPINVTAGLTFRCQSRCKTCRVYERSARELTAGEWRRVFEGLGTAPYWFTFSGGEPFLRKDTPEIVTSAIELCRPGIVNIPTNGLLTDRIAEGVGEICDAAGGAQVIINVSLDGVGKQHDEIRGVPGGYEKAVETVKRLKALGHSRLTVGIHTVISQFNAHDIGSIAPELLALEPDSYVTEMAEERVELGTMGLGITPDAEAYTRAIDQVEQALEAHSAAGVSATVRAFRREYYRMAREYLQTGERSIPCWAGLASTQIAPDGDVWFCCIRAEPVGNLRDADFDFAAVWSSDEAQRLRRSVAAGECACPLANAAYTNMLCHTPTMLRVLGRRFRRGAGGGRQGAR